MAPSPERERFGVLLVNTGTPDEPKPRAVRKYLGKFLMDRRIAPMNRACWWLILHLCILPRRGTVSAGKYAKIWTADGSPFAVAHDRLRSGVEAALRAEGVDAHVRCGMSYSDPSVLDCLRELKDAGCTRLVVLPLYPQSAHSTTGSVSDSVHAGLARTRWNVPMQFIERYSDNDAYVSAIAASVEAAGFAAEAGDRLLFSFHSIPLKDIEAGDTYELETGSTSLSVAGALGLARTQWTIGYHCRFDKGREWLSPFSRDVLARWAEAGAGRVFVVCPNFAVDCLETLYDIEFELKPFFLDQACAAGREAAEGDFVYVPCLDRSRAHVNVLANVLRPYVKGESHG